MKENRSKSKFTMGHFFLLSLLFVAVLPSVLLGIYQTVSSGWALENMEEKDLMRSLRSASSLVDSYLKNHRNKIVTLSHLIEKMPIKDPEEILYLMRDFTTTDMGFREFRLVNSVGYTIASYPTPVAMTDYLGTVWFKQIRENSEVLTINKLQDTKFLKNHIGLAVPLKSEGEFAGALLGFIDLEVLGDILFDTINYPVIITDEQGFNIYTGSSKNEKEYQLNTLFAQGVNPFTPYWISGDNTQCLSAYNAIPQYNWNVVVEKPRDQIKQHWLDRMIISFLGVGIMIAFMFALIPWFERLIFAPFMSLHRGFRSIIEKGELALMDEKQEIKEFQDIAIDFNTMVRRLDNIITEMDRNFLASIESLSKAIEFRDKYTGGHSQRVSKYSALVAKEMGFDNKTIERIKIVGLLHDIGKIGVPGAILNKPGLLTEKEWQKIKNHPLIAVEILSTGPFRDLIPMIRAHHERYDGKGYPDGLQGDEIPMIAQIMGVADAFDAMTSNRVYRPKMSVAEAKVELIKNRGTQFSPVVVDAFVKLIDKEIITEASPDVIALY